MKTKYLLIGVMLSALVSAGAQARLPYVVGQGLNGCDTVYTLPDRKAEFPGGVNAMYGFFTDNMKGNYNFIPSMSTRRVLLKIMVDDSGSVVDSKIMMPSATSLDEELLRVVSLFPDMVPAKYKGRDVCSYMIIPLGYE